MTNEEWLKSLPTIKLHEFLQCYCNFCAYNEWCTGVGICSDGILEWLRGEHKDD